VELDGVSINVLGSTLGLAPIAFDIASAVQAGGTTAVSAASASAASPAQAGTVTRSVSTNTTQPGIVPSTTAATTTAQQAAGKTPLGSLLCSVDGFRNAGNPTQLAQQLNAILTALSTTQGS
jgi:hypothetical protein